ncbi:MAG TPA: hypothetical protein ENI96_00610 [Sedimenticola thiotaurini]|uniref:G domain-containing protein n=1 Tax=Sedimenticola thiotaurini TaxID=1543721 RepID=A0A831RHZ7_9GAMM|nr:hypothetical protein [Sedimenticola thiotaurini]
MSRREEALSRIHPLVAELHRHQRGLPEGIADGAARSPSLVYADGLLRHALAGSERSLLPRQLVVIGPTQSGKSTLVNLLLGAQAAQASPLAGFTRHAQGFLCGTGAEGWSGVLQRLLPDWERLPAADQAGARGDQYSVQAVVTDPAPWGREPLLVWDTPDFDSVASCHYRDSVPALCALADLVLLVVSREKYADQSVWNMLRLLSGVGIPLLICLNKVDSGSEAALLDSLRSRLTEESLPCAGLLTLPYRAGIGDDPSLSGEGDDLRRHCSALLERDRGERPGLAGFLRRHWPAWTGPVRNELDAADQWRQQVEEAVTAALQIYRRDYLEDTRCSDALQRAMVQLLELLEIPGLAAALVRARRLVTWPANRIRELVRTRRRQAGGGPGPDAETRVLDEALGHLLTRLQHGLAERALEQGPPLSAWWQAMGRDFDRERQPLEQAFTDATGHYRAGFDHEIQQAARRLMRHLQAHPVTLNSLRAARVTTDAAAVALAVKTGGIGLNDLIVAPAMLSFTTLLTEGAVGGYLQQVGKELRQRQQQLVEETLFRGVVVPRLDSLPERIRCDRCHGIRRETLEQADRALESLRG